MCLFFFFFFKQKTAYEMRISDWSSDVCSSDLFRPRSHRPRARFHQTVPVRQREASASLFLPNRLIVRRRKLTDFAQARLDMFESGLFGQGNAFWRWIATAEARPYLTAFAVDPAPPSGREFFAADLSAEDLLDSERSEERRVGKE